MMMRSTGACFHDGSANMVPRETVLRAAMNVYIGLCKGAFSISDETGTVCGFPERQCLPASAAHRSETAVSRAQRSVKEMGRTIPACMTDKKMPPTIPATAVSSLGCSSTSKKKLELATLDFLHKTFTFV